MNNKLDLALHNDMYKVKDLKEEVSLTFKSHGLEGDLIDDTVEALVTTVVNNNRFKDGKPTDIHGLALEDFNYIVDCCILNDSFKENAIPYFEYNVNNPKNIEDTIYSMASLICKILHNIQDNQDSNGTYNVSAINKHLTDCTGFISVYNRKGMEIIKKLSEYFYSVDSDITTKLVTIINNISLFTHGLGKYYNVESVNDFITLSNKVYEDKLLHGEYGIIYLNELIVSLSKIDYDNEDLMYNVHLLEDFYSSKINIELKYITVNIKSNS